MTSCFESIRAASGREKANAVLARFRDSFSSAYERDYQIHNAVADIEIFSHLDANQIHCVLSSSTRQNSDNASFKIYCRENSIALSDALPILENMGVRILGGRPQKLVTTDGEIFRIREFEVAREDGLKFDYEDNARQFESTFTNCWNGVVENDGFNKLTLLAGLSWRRISLLRTYFRYLKQIRLRYSENYIIDALVNNPKLVVTISNLFAAKFDPRKNQEGTRKFSSEVKKTTRRSQHSRRRSYYPCVT